MDSLSTLVAPEAPGRRTGWPSPFGDSPRNNEMALSGHSLFIFFIFFVSFCGFLEPYGAGGACQI